MYVYVCLCVLCFCVSASMSVSVAFPISPILMLVFLSASVGGNRSVVADGRYPDGAEVPRHAHTFSVSEESLIGEESLCV